MLVEIADYQTLRDVVYSVPVTIRMGTGSLVVDSFFGAGLTVEGCGRSRLEHIYVEGGLLNIKGGGEDASILNFSGDVRLIYQP